MIQSPLGSVTQEPVGAIGLTFCLLADDGEIGAEARDVLVATICGESFLQDVRSLGHGHLGKAELSRDDQT